MILWIFENMEETYYSLRLLFEEKFRVRRISIAKERSFINSTTLEDIDKFETKIV
jgi:hypothetical protein